MFAVTEEHLRILAQQPHLIGHLAGKNKLGPMHSQWILDAWKSEDSESLQAHRGSYKTTAVTEIGCVWWLLFHPEDRIGLGRKTFTEAAATLKTIHRYMSIEAIQALFYKVHGFPPKAIVRRDNQLVYNFKTIPTKEGSIDAHGIDAAWTGTHYDKIVLDDIITLKDRLSKADRERTKEAVREIYTNIIDPGKQVIHSGTPWHKDDAWNEPCMPKPKKYDVHVTGLLDAKAQSEKRSRTTSVLYSINYELKHTATADMIFPEAADVQPWIWDMTVTNIYAHVDAKFQGKHFGALTIMATRPDGRIQAKGWVFTENVEEKITWIQDLCSQHRVKKLYIERNPDKGYTERLLAKQERLKRKFMVEGYNESMNKTIKIATHLKGRWLDIVWDIDTQVDYLEQIIDYREFQEPDDAPDSAASLIRAEFPIQSTKMSDFALYQL